MVEPSKIITPLRQKIFLVAGGMLVFLFLLEFGLRLGGFVFLSVQEYRNQLAIRQRGAYRIMCLGESTTALGGGNSYPSQLENVLNERGIGIKFSVINKGEPCVSTAGIVSSLEANLDNYRPDLIVAMMGINDDNSHMPQEIVLSAGAASFPGPLRTYKLIRLLWLRGITKASKPGDNNTVPREMVTQEAKELNHKNEMAHIELGELYSRQGKFSKAEGEFKKAIGLNPNYSGTRISLGLCYVSQGRFSEAEGEFKKAVELNPESEGTYTALGSYYISQSRFSEAEQLLRQAVAVNPDNDRVYGRLAAFYAETKNYKLLEEYWEKARSMRKAYYQPVTINNYRRLKQILDKRGLRLVCVQYPVRSIEPLKKMFGQERGVIFVDNEKLFKDALKNLGYKEYFTDTFAGDFGHCTPRGNRLLAGNIAKVILEEVFKKQE